MATISGTIRDGQGLPLSAASVRIWQVSGGQTTFDVTLTTGANGAYSQSGIFAPTVSTTYVQPSKNGYTFVPTRITQSNIKSSDVLINQDFVGASFSVSGTIKNESGQGVGGLTIKILQYSSNGSKIVDTQTTTNSYGQYSIAGLGGSLKTCVYATGVSDTSGALINSLWNFSPSSHCWSASEFITNKTQDFTGYSYVISGYLTNSSGSPLSGLEVAMKQYNSSGTTIASSSIQTNDSGFYQFFVAGRRKTGLYVQYRDGAWINTSYSFSPSSFTVTDTAFTANITQNFVSLSHSVSGTVKRSDGSPLKNTKLLIKQYAPNDSSVLIETEATSDENGNFNYSPLADGRAVRITPQKVGCTFSPSYTYIAKNSFTSDYTTTFSASCAELFTVAGRVTSGSGSSGLSNVTITLTYLGETADTVTTNANGYYSIPDVAFGNYTITASYTDCSFSQSSQSILVSSSLSNINFDATCSSKPSSIISADMTFGAAPLTVSFDGSNSSDPSGGSLTYAWNFGDGSTSSDESPTHEFAKKGDFLVVLTVTTSDNVSATSSLHIVVGMPIRDSVSFVSGPLRGQCFPVSPSNPIGEDEIGRYIQIQIPTNYSLSEPFPSSDDYYASLWSLSSLEDTGLIGTYIPTGDDANKAINNETAINDLLNFPEHSYNGVKVPSSHPSIFSARSYVNTREGSQYVYLAYQAWEDHRWKIYLRQIRLSEFRSSVDSLMDAPIPILDGEVFYVISCQSDNCSELSNDQYALSRTIVMEIKTSEGRDVFNAGLESGTWGNLCPNKTPDDFPRSKAFVSLTQTVVLSGITCDSADEALFDTYFVDWAVGQSYAVPNDSLTAVDLFSILQRSGDSAVLGDFGDRPEAYEGTWVHSSSIVGTWLKDPSQWVVMNDESAEELARIKGVDIADPILISSEEDGHCMNPCVRVDYNNHVFVAYEATEGDLPKIVLVGTSDPSSFLPVGSCPSRDPDSTLNYFFHVDDFAYRATISESGSKPDMYVDLNNDIHLVWHSNTDGYWNIYYSNYLSEWSVKQITNTGSKSLCPKIDGDELGNLFIVWQDDRFGHWEIMCAYQVLRRTIPLLQQDPYLASLWDTEIQHYTDDPVTISLENATDSFLCLSQVNVGIYSDRTLENLLWTLDTVNHPYAFSIPEGKNDSSSVIIDFNGYVGGDGTFELDELDTSLYRSQVMAISLSITIPGTTTVEISFRASDTESDPDAAFQWTDWAEITDGYTLFDALGITNVEGRYKQLRLRITYLSGSSDPTFNSGLLYSISIGRVCIPPNTSTALYFFLQPDSQIPIQFIPNQTYFIGLSGLDESASIVSLPNPNVSFSCESCSSLNGKYTNQTCSILVAVENTSDVTEFHDLLIKIYKDNNYVDEVESYLLQYASADMARVYIDAEQSAAWTPSGLPVLSGTKRTLIVKLDMDQSGLSCGVSYFVKIFNCTGSCVSEDDFDLLSTQTLSCECPSESSPENFYNIERWRCSADGYGDTRITDTKSLMPGIPMHSLRPTIKMRKNLNGVILYQSNRDVASPNSYSVYASVFNAIPSYEMYASGAQSITSKTYVLSKIDLPMSSIGTSPALDIDLFDNLFVAWNVPVTQETCNGFEENKQTILIRRCGAQAKDIVFEHELQESSAESFLPSLLETSFVNTALEDSLINQFRVRNDGVSYHATIRGSLTPVVSQRSVVLEIVASPETVAIRLRNGQAKWSEWMPFDANVGGQMAEIPWTLSENSGFKTVTVQSTTLAGLSAQKSITIAADYQSEQYEISLYRLSQTATFEDTSYPFPSEPDIYKQENRLVETTMPLAGIRLPSVVDGILVAKDSDFIFVEIVPPDHYVEQFPDIERRNDGSMGIEPTFDVLNQGLADQFGLKTYLSSSNGRDVFRGVFTIYAEGTGFSKDGLSEIVVHFKEYAQKEQPNDTFERDPMNRMSIEQRTITQEDVFNEERDRLGRIAHQITVRPAEDPYFVFGDPNYRVDHE